MKIRYWFLFALAVSFQLSSVAAEATNEVRLELWNGCLCGGPTHSRTYDELKNERGARMLFGTNVTVSVADTNLSAVAFLRSHVKNTKFKDRADWYWMGVIYRPADGRSHAVQFNGSLKKHKMSNVRNGDLIVYYQESY